MIGLTFCHWKNWQQKRKARTECTIIGNNGKMMGRTHSLSPHISLKDLTNGGTVSLLIVRSQWLSWIQVNLNWFSTAWNVNNFTEVHKAVPCLCVVIRICLWSLDRSCFINNSTVLPDACCKLGFLWKFSMLGPNHLNQFRPVAHLGSCTMPAGTVQSMIIDWKHFVFPFDNFYEVYRRLARHSPRAEANIVKACNTMQWSHKIS